MEITPENILTVIDMIQKIYIMLVYCLVVGTLDSFSQTVPISSKENDEGMILYTSTLRFSGMKMTQADTLLFRNSLVLEPVKEESTVGETNLTTNVSKSSTAKKLRWYCITDVSKMIGMSFDVEKTPTSKNIRTFSSKSKDIGFAMTVEPFFFKDGYNLSDYSKVGDTVFRGQKCIIVKANRRIPVYHNSMRDELLFTKMFINTQIKGRNYPFISEILAKHFGGAIVFAQSSYKSGANISMMLEYTTGLPLTYTALFDKYQDLYLSNIALLDKRK